MAKIKTAHMNILPLVYFLITFSVALLLLRILKPFGQGKASKLSLHIISTHSNTTMLGKFTLLYSKINYMFNEL